MKEDDSSACVDDPIVEVVCFPPPGIVPLDLLYGVVPIWSVMPDSHLYQPTPELAVSIWRVRIVADQVERFEEVRTLCLSADCSQRGNPFCIVFRPDLARIADGDEFEVTVRGLRSQPHRPELCFFHRFVDFNGAQLDAHLVAETRRFRSSFDDLQLWGEPKVFIGQEAAEAADKDGKKEEQQQQKQQQKGPEKSPQAEKAGDPSTPSAKDAGGRRATVQEAPKQQIPDIGLISHQKQTFHSERCDVTITVSCPLACVMRCQLFLVRVSGREEIPRATQIAKIGDHFIVRVKLPMAHCRWELTFKVSTNRAPEALMDHPLKYNITSAETSENLLISVEHPLAEKFGYALLQHTAQIHGVTVISPLTHRVREGHTYFLIHIDRSCTRHPPEPQTPPGEAPPPPTATNLFNTRLTSANAIVHSAPTQPSRGSRPAQGRSRIVLAEPESEMPGQLAASRRGIGIGGEAAAVCAIGAFHEQLAGNEKEPGISACVQDSVGGIHCDVSICNGKYMQRLRQRLDFPELYDGLLPFSRQDAGGRVELFIRFPRGNSLQYTPLKIGEWLIIKSNEEFPMGF